ncbi:Dolichyl-phosphate-mannose-protein mannosyltransferase-domain-containing protein [Hyaloraphidium curvatum]|nr:Dolichyl-phosphate-mannose-protein mannosyltransferase-domain-containing protein [Hyaloraphidium curvatum]
MSASGSGFLRRRRELQDAILSPVEDDDDEIIKKRQRWTAHERTYSDKIIAGVLTVVAAVVRLLYINHPKQVVFDEVHFGGFANQYLKGTMHVDVHPPLAKLLITLAGLLGGYHGQFTFKEIGMDIPDDVPYVSMRLLGGICGLLTVPLAFLTMRASGHTPLASVLTAVFVLFENSHITQFRLILLDAPLVFFTALSIYAWCRFWSFREHPFTKWWWYWLTITGLGLGASVSSKWVGLFVIAMIGTSTVKDLWMKLTEPTIPPAVFARHFLARALCLIALPITFYVCMFGIHLLVLRNAGNAAGFVSPELAATFDGNTVITETMSDVMVGSKVFIRHVGTTGGYLHSHVQTYPTGSKQQQVTLYPYGDENSWFLVGRPQGETRPAPDRIRSGDTITLLHLPTKRRLHSHDHRPPMSDQTYQNEVSCYGTETTNDPNDHWVVEIVKGDPEEPRSSDEVMTFRTLFRLRHRNRGCHLFSHPVKLPKWGFEQQEVTCGTGVLKSNTVWRVEASEHPEYMNDTSMKVTLKRPGFLAKVMELQSVMWNVNSGLTSTHPFDSRPSTWPVLSRGISFWSGKDKYKDMQIYLIGNPVVWFAGGISIVVGLVALLVWTVASRRSGEAPWVLADGVPWTYMSSFIFFAQGWALHWLPFFLMKRQLFLHHYLPAEYVSILAFGALFDFCTERARAAVSLAMDSARLSPGAWRALRWASLRAAPLLAAALATWAMLEYWRYAPIAYGFRTTPERCAAMSKLRPTWDWNCPAA